MKRLTKVLTVAALVFGSGGVALATIGIINSTYEVMMFLLIFVLGYFVGTLRECERWMKEYKEW